MAYQGRMIEKVSYPLVRPADVEGIPAFLQSLGARKQDGGRRDVVERPGTDHRTAIDSDRNDTTMLAAMPWIACFITDSHSI